ncbi:MAG: pseudouridine-5'-phosphate glycosidase [Anaerolineaceae bacterium]|nr:MAG: pseudouridine-5'-phosphate glycosidase [Anaerolineaceae bacterium]
MPIDIPEWLHVHPDVGQALESAKPVVALESTVITHGLPRPVNLDLARWMETEVISVGVQPATVAIIDGIVRFGLSNEELENLALTKEVHKISRRDLATAVAKRQTGGTTVAATIFVAHSIGVQVFATGGIGGVHRGSTGDISADLPELARRPIVVVCSGAKAILDLPRTVEWLETASVPVIGWGTEEFPAFFSRKSGLPVSLSLTTLAEIGAFLRSHWRMGIGSGVLICVPCPEDAAVPREVAEEAIAKAEIEAQESNITGGELTPYLLSRLAELTEGATLRANLELLKNNAHVAATIAKALF